MRSGALGLLLGCVARLWLATLRVRVTCDPALASIAHRPWVLAFFHGTQFPLLAWPRRRATVVLVSLSRDGAIQSRALAAQGFEIVRGSSSRQAARGLASLVRVMRRQGADAAFAVDGPKGPRGIAKGGAIAAARAVGAAIVPMGGAAAHSVVLAKAWDRFAIAWPFSRVSVHLGAPLDPTRTDCAELSQAIARANVKALSAGTSA